MTQKILDFRRVELIEPISLSIGNIEVCSLTLWTTQNREKQRIGKSFACPVGHLDYLKSAIEAAREKLEMSQDTIFDWWLSEMGVEDLDFLIPEVLIGWKVKSPTECGYPLSWGKLWHSPDWGAL